MARAHERQRRGHVAQAHKAALDDAFATAHRTHFDNDSGSFASPHPDALDAIKLEAVIRAIDSVLATVLD